MARPLADEAIAIAAATLAAAHIQCRQAQGYSAPSMAEAFADAVEVVRVQFGKAEDTPQ